MQHSTKRAEHRPESPSGSTQQAAYLVVGLGASAGGLAALGRFFDRLPPDLEACYVVIVHLSSTHQSQFEPLLQRHTSMPVLQVREPMRLEPRHVYILPPGKDLSLLDGMLRLSDPEGRKPRAEIDLFFRSLADAHGERSVAIVLSGTGSDGAVGIKRVKELGGITMAQAPEDAEHGAMPTAAIATGMIDMVAFAKKFARSSSSPSTTCSRTLRFPG